MFLCCFITLYNESNWLNILSQNLKLYRQFKNSLHQTIHKKKKILLFNYSKRYKNPIL